MRNEENCRFGRELSSNSPQVELQHALAFRSMQPADSFSFSSSFQARKVGKIMTFQASNPRKYWMTATLVRDGPQKPPLEYLSKKDIIFWKKSSRKIPKLPILCTNFFLFIACGKQTIPRIWSILRSWGPHDIYDYTVFLRSL